MKKASPSVCEHFMLLSKNAVASAQQDWKSRLQVFPMPGRGNRSPSRRGGSWRSRVTGSAAIGVGDVWSSYVSLADPCLHRINIQFVSAHFLLLWLVSPVNLERKGSEHRPDCSMAGAIDQHLAGSTEQRPFRKKSDRTRATEIDLRLKIGVCITPMPITSDGGHVAWRTGHRPHPPAP